VRPVVPTAIDKLLDQMGIAEERSRFAALSGKGWLADLAAAGFHPVAAGGRIPAP
jgi:methionyl-tRNA synthetase